MTIYKDSESGTWNVEAYYCDWKGNQSRKHKRGFDTKRDAKEWERDFLCRYADDLTMTFEQFFEVYAEDRRPRLKLNTWLQKESVVMTKIMPYFGSKPMNEIASRDIIRWQNELIQGKNKMGRPYSGTYLKTIHNQLTAIFTHAHKLYGLKINPATKAGSMGQKNADEMSFWTRDEYRAFAEVAIHDSRYYYAFEVLYWCGIRLGELLALTEHDIDFKKKTIRISRSYQRIRGEDVITDPKTKKSKRTIAIPDALCMELRQYIAIQYGYEPGDRLFPLSKSKLAEFLKKTAKAAGIKPIRVHDVRHSHVSHLIELGYTAVAIAERLGHESIEITFRYAHLFPQKQEEMANRLNDEMEVFDYGEECGAEPKSLSDGRFQVLRFGAA